MANQDSFTTDWVELQRKYWDDWLAMSSRAMGMAGQASPTASWEAALEHWWKALSPAASDQARSFMDQLLEQSRLFFRMAETVSATTSTAAAGEGLHDWSEALADMQKRLFDGLGDGSQAAARMMGFWSQPLEQWQRMASATMPKDFAQAMPFADQFERILGAPGLGYTREQQEQYQALALQMRDYQSALNDYTAFYADLGTASVRRMGERLQGLVEQGERIESARALYDHWVDCCEAVYAEAVMTPEYSAIHGRLVNAQMKVKQGTNALLERQFAALNLPTRQELRTVHQRLQETRRENRALARRLEALEQLVGSTMAASPKAPAALKSSARTASRRKGATAKGSGAGVAEPDAG